MSGLDKWFDYTGESCENCGRIRVLMTESGKRNWRPENQTYHYDEDKECQNA